MDNGGTPYLRFRLGNIDSYQATPTSLDRNDFAKVPVIRIWGAADESGQKVCCHVHGVYPYCYIEYSGNLIPDEVDAHIQRLHMSIDHAMAMAYRRNPHDPKNNTYVARITLCKGVPVYGFHVGWKFYLKIYMLNPAYMQRLADLLRNKSIMGHVIQPYEVHIPYLLQFMADFGLYGCGWVECQRVLFRAPVPVEREGDNNRTWNESMIPQHLITSTNDRPRLSHCAIEIDIQSHDILNRQTIKPRLLHYDFVERKHPVPLDEKLVHSMAELWEDYERRRAQKGDTQPTPSLFTSESRDSAEHKETKRWIHEDELRIKLDEVIRLERAKSDGHALNFDTFVKRTSFDSLVQTALESVTDMFPPERPSSSQKREDYVGINASSGHLREHSGDFPSADVDEGRIADLLDDPETNIDTRWNDSASLKDEEYFSDEDQSESVSEVDFDADLLGRGQQESHENQITRADMLSPDYASTSFHDTLDIPNFSDDFDLDFDLSSPTRRLVPDPSKSTILGQGENDDRDIDFNEEARILRLRGGASSPEHKEKKRKRNEPTSTNSGKRPKALTLVMGGSQPHNPQVTRSLLNSGSSKTSTPGVGATLAANPVPKRRAALDIMVHLSPHLHTPSTHGISTIEAIQFPPSQLASPPAQDVLSPLSLESQQEAKVPRLSRGMKYLHTHKPSSLLVRQLTWSVCPPSANALLSNLHQLGIPRVVPRCAYYSKAEDVPISVREYAGREFRLVSDSLPYLDSFDAGLSFTGSIIREGPAPMPYPGPTWKVWQFERRPPSWRSNDILQLPSISSGSGFQSAFPSIQAPRISQIEGVTQKHKFGFKFTQRRKAESAEQELHYMSVMSLEVHVNTRGTLLPNPEEDCISCVFWCIQTPQYASIVSDDSQRSQSGIIMVKDDGDSTHIRLSTNVTIDEEDTELDLINRLTDTVRNFDPDILAGYEVQSSSWGYVIERARIHFEFDLCDEFSRMKTMSHGRFGRENDRWGFTQASAIRVTGRHMINIWRAMRGELNLSQYTLENVAFHLLHRRIPHYSHADLTRWYKDASIEKRMRVLRYYMSRCSIDLEILEAQELIARVCEQARVLGIDFYSVFSRGSQFKVESLMVRISKAECLMLVSPSRKQVGQQNALECIPLVMEPRSNFYPSPLLVLDFQSLYPSIVIAYNYCYSTCLGRVGTWKNQNKMGFTDLRVPERLLELLKDDINVAPNGFMYVKSSVRRGLLAKMLSEILDTRVMVKDSMKLDDNKSFIRLQNNRQLALKYIANVTYGYTSASFSGRMPCAEIADSIVQTGRETLEKAIEVIHSKSEWGAEVVYGDTDSLFVYLPGRSKEDAFNIGEDIAATITRMNPQPIKLKFEKVYHPCVLLAKKRYVGFKYESRKDTHPVFDAKGIETVRRDGTPAQQKIEEAALKLLFRTADLSLVKEYFQRQCSKILSNKVSIQDFCFAKEVKLGTYSEKGLPPPGAIISARKMVDDPRAEPQYGERVPYVVTAGPPGSRLIDRVVSPEEMLKNKDMRLDAEYYISKTLIPPLERIFNLVGANVRSWYDEMPKVQRIEQRELLNIRDISRRQNTATLHSYMRSRLCVVCKLEDTDEGLCESCRADPAESARVLSSRLQESETRYVQLQTVCASCCSVPRGEEIACDSRDCPVFYSRLKSVSRLEHSLTREYPLLRGIGDESYSDEVFNDW